MNYSTKVLRYTIILIISICFYSCEILIDSIFFPNKCTCKVVERDFVVNENGFGEWQDVVYLDRTVYKSKNIEELKKECQEVAELHPFSSCECD